MCKATIGIGRTPGNYWIEWTQATIGWTQATIGWTQVTIGWTQATIGWTQALIWWTQATIGWTQATIGWTQALIWWTQATIGWTQATIGWTQALIWWTQASLQVHQKQLKAGVIPNITGKFYKSKLYLQDWNFCLDCSLNLKGQYRHDQSRLSTGHGVGVLQFTMNTVTV